MQGLDRPVSEELAFLSQHTGEDETSLLARALHVGLELLYREAVEKAFIDGQLTAEDAAETLGTDRVKDIQYAQQALAEDVARGLDL